MIYMLYCYFFKYVCAIFPGRLWIPFIALVMLGSALCMVANHENLFLNNLSLALWPFVIKFIVSILQHLFFCFITEHLLQEQYHGRQ